MLENGVQISIAWTSTILKVLGPCKFSIEYHCPSSNVQENCTFEALSHIIQALLLPLLAAPEFSSI